MPPRQGQSQLISPVSGLYAPPLAPSDDGSGAGGVSVCAFSWGFSSTTGEEAEANAGEYKICGRERKF